MDIEDIEAKTIISKSQISDNLYTANPYIGCSHSCIYCYATFMRRFTNHMDQKWGSFVDVKYWKPLTQRQLLKYKNKWILISSTTDPYQNKVEKKSKRTRELLIQLQSSGANISILTKSDLVLRDIDILQQFKGKVAIGFSINTVDEKLKNEQDKAPSISARINALKQLHELNFYTYCFIAPVFPYLTDLFSIINTVRPYVNEIWVDSLNLLDSNVKHQVYSYILHKHPQLMDIYYDIYTNHDNTYYKHLVSELKQYCKANNITYAGNKMSTYNAKKVLVRCFI